MKLALRYIPTEVWVDVFCYPWITRKRLSKIVHKFRNRYFAEILQYCLHERGKQSLGYLQFNEDGIYKCLERKADLEKLDIVQTPMPENIKFFERIEIKHFDSRTLDFLRRISTLFNEVNLHVPGLRSYHSTIANLRTILDHLCPLLHGIRSLSFDQEAIPLVQQYFTPKLAQLKILAIDLQFDRAAVQASINFCLSWLISGEREDSTEPRFLKVFTSKEETFQQFTTAVRQQFQSAKHPSTFVIKVLCYHEYDSNLDLENNIGEQLHGQFEEYGDFWIYRHKQVDFTRTQLQEWFKGIVEKLRTSSRITFFPQLSIGQIDANGGANEVDDNAGEEEEDQPSTSKKPKLT